MIRPKWQRVTIETRQLHLSRDHLSRPTHSRASCWLQWQLRPSL